LVGPLGRIVIRKGKPDPLPFLIVAAELAEKVE
jgi:hypothetical protein